MEISLGCSSFGRSRLRAATRTVHGNHAEEHQGLRGAGKSILHVACLEYDVRYQAHGIMMSFSLQVVKIFGSKSNIKDTREKDGQDGD